MKHVRKKSSNSEISQSCGQTVLCRLVQNSLLMLPNSQRSRGSRGERENLASPELPAPISAQRASHFLIAATSSWWKCCLLKWNYSLTARGLVERRHESVLLGFTFWALLFYEANVMFRFFLFTALRDSLSSLSQHPPNLPVPYLSVTDSLSEVVSMLPELGKCPERRSPLSLFRAGLRSCWDALGIYVYFIMCCLAATVSVTQGFFSGQ